MNVHIFARAIMAMLAAMMLAPPGQGRALTLDECVALALKNNPGLQQQKVSINQSEQDLQGLRAKNLGQLDFVSGYTHYNTPRTLTPMTPATMAGSPETVPTTRNLFTSALVYEVPLFTGFSQTRSVEIANIGKEMARAAFTLGKEQLIYNVKALYVNILSLRHQLQAQKAYVASLERLRADVAEKLRQGRLARIDLLKAEADVENGRAVAGQIEANLAMVRAALARLLAVDRLGELMDIPVAAKAMRPAGLDPRQQGKNGELARIKRETLNIAKSDRLVAKAQGSYYPQIALAASYGRNYGPNDDSHLNSGDWEDQEVWQAGLNLTWNILDFGVTKTAVQKARLAARKARLAKLETELDLKKNLLEAQKKIDTAIGDYKSARGETAMTRETEAIEQVRYDQGAGDITDLLLAKARNRLAQGRLIDAGYRYLSSRYYLDYLLERGSETIGNEQ